MIQRLTRLGGALAALPLLLCASAGAQETASVFGRILNQDTFQPIAGVVVRVTVGDGALQDISGPRGTFLIPGVPVGERVVVLEHIAYGEYARHVTVEPGNDLKVNAHMSPRAIQFDPVVVEVLTEVERRRLTSGFNVNEIPREEIEVAARTGMELGGLLRGGMPGLRVRGANRTGGYLCVEYRGSGAGECNELAVYLDGVPVSDPGMIYSSLTLDDIDRVEVLSPLEAVIRYGDRAARGALLIESSAPSLPDEPDFPGARLGAFDWSMDDESHSWAKVLGGSALANAVGVGFGYLVLNQCVKTERGEAGRHFESSCPALLTMSTGVIALSLPAAAGSLAGTRAGSTQASSGRFFPALVAGLISTTAGYVMVMHGEDAEYKSTSVRLAGAVTLAVGTPLLQTFSDRLFRRLR